jgi:hypothetical protein
VITTHSRASPIEEVTFGKAEAMQSLKASDHSPTVLSAVTEWWRNWMSRRAAIHDLNCCGEDETAHIARDIGVGPSELRTLAGKWPDRADLLSRRIEGTGLVVDQIEGAEPQVMRDLQRVCTQCDDPSRCERDLNRDGSDRIWRGYCPNVATLDALRKEDRDRRLLRRRRQWRSF